MAEKEVGHGKHDCDEKVADRLDEQGTFSCDDDDKEERDTEGHGQREENLEKYKSAFSFEVGEGKAVEETAKETGVEEQMDHGNIKSVFVSGVTINCSAEMITLRAVAIVDDDLSYEVY